MAVLGIFDIQAKTVYKSVSQMGELLFGRQRKWCVSEMCTDMYGSLRPLWYRQGAAVRIETGVRVGWSQRF